MNKKRLILFVGLLFCKSIFSAAAEAYDGRSYGVVSRVGSLNESNKYSRFYLQEKSPEGKLYSVMGILDYSGDEGSKVAEYVVSSVKTFSHQEFFRSDLFLRKIRQLNAKIQCYEWSKENGTTLSLLALEPESGKAVVHNIGDSAVCLWSNSDDHLDFITKGHTLDNEEAKIGLTRYLGRFNFSECGLVGDPESKEFDLSGDLGFVVCSRSLASLLRYEEIKEVVRGRLKKGMSANAIAFVLVAKAIDRCDSDSLAAFVVREKFPDREDYEPECDLRDLMSLQSSYV